ncbi:MAG: hypothetical protein HKN26_08360 [Acidimicrobiales bacterium]|nr:hypothetical protein [Acidimicrobiales bacterium]
MTTPLDALQALGTADQRLAPDLELIEIYTMGGMLKLLWHGTRDADEVVMLLGGAMGGFLGPGKVYHRLGQHLAAQGRAAVHVDYRRPDKLDQSLLDAAAATDLAMRQGGRKFVALGHSFGGAVAVQLAVAVGAACEGVATVATQSAGCEIAEQLHPTPLLLIHGGEDVILPAASSEMVRMIAGYGDYDFVPDADHNFTHHGTSLFERLSAFIDTSFASAPEPDLTPDIDPDSETDLS